MAARDEETTQTVIKLIVYGFYRDFYFVVNGCLNVTIML
jgi:hypothetical protein